MIPAAEAAAEAAATDELLQALLERFGDSIFKPGDVARTGLIPLCKRAGVGYPSARNLYKIQNVGLLTLRPILGRRQVRFAVRPWDPWADWLQSYPPVRLEKR